MFFSSTIASASIYMYIYFVFSYYHVKTYLYCVRDIVPKRL